MNAHELARAFYENLRIIMLARYPLLERSPWDGLVPEAQELWVAAANATLKETK